MHEITTSESAPRRRSRRARPEVVFLRPSLYAVRGGMSTTTLHRLRQIPGFPRVDALGRLDVRKADKFLADLTVETLRAAREAEEARTAARRAQRQAAIEKPAHKKAKVGSRAA